MAKGKKAKQQNAGGGGSGGGGGYSGSRKGGGLAKIGPVIGGVLAVCAGLYFLSGAGTIAQLDAKNAAQMKEVIYGGKPWVVLCHKGGSKSSAASAHPMFAKVSIPLFIISSCVDLHVL